jgi:hypothetical protein
VLGFLIEFVARPPAWPAVGAESAATARRHVGAGEPRRCTGFARLGAFLVDGAGSDLLGGVLLLAAGLGALFDVLVLAFPLGAPCLLRHLLLLMVRLCDLSDWPAASDFDDGGRAVHADTLWAKD